MSRVKTEKEIAQGISRKIANERARLRLSSHTEAFRTLFLYGVESLIYAYPESMLNEFGLGPNEPTAMTPKDVFTENCEKFMNCWTVVAITIAGGERVFKERDKTRQEQVKLLVPMLDEYEWNKLRYHVVRKRGSNGYTPEVSKEWRHELEELR